MALDLICCRMAITNKRDRGSEEERLSTLMRLMDVCLRCDDHPTYWQNISLYDNSHHS